MCGLAGMLGAPEPTIVRKMIQYQNHRGTVLVSGMMNRFVSAMLALPSLIWRKPSTHSIARRKRPYRQWGNLQF